ncbi:MAG: hypothetical protein DHS20C16_13760 [Phycisphaerae bacterium]|nr:MAG: hypothetical protein DHS20C16_13760 [Phycisphaerae bacterium]
MTPNQAEQLLNGFLSRVVSSLGFSRITDGRYGRPEHDATAILSFPLRFSAHGLGVFTIWVTLRYESLARWLDDKDESVANPTTIMPIHLLHEDKNFVEWKFSNAEELESSREAVLGELRSYAMPFIERYAKLPELRKALESHNKQDWFDIGLNVDTRVTTLAAIQMVEGDKAGAIKTLDCGIKLLGESLADRPETLRRIELRKRSRDMENLRKRLLAND